MTLYFEKYDDTELTTIFRDLAKNENLDVRKLFDTFKQLEKRKNKKHKSSGDKIIEENIQRKEEKEKDRDKERFKYYDELHTLTPNILDELSNFRTKYGKDRMKMKLLDLAFKANNIPLVINLYLQLLNDNYETKKEKRLMDKVTEIMKKLNYKRMQFEKLSNELYPLDFYNEYEKKLDKWQINVLKNIDNDVSSLVCAPTSCGKTWLAIYPGISGKRVLFIVPTVALVYQVASLFVKFGANIFIITADFTYGNSKNNVIIGTPKDIEDKLPILGINYDIVVYDEIHNLGTEEFGHYYERLIKILNKNVFLALSATIYNPNELKNWFETVTNNKVDLITYTTRFLNLQRHIFNSDKLTKIHPMACLRKEDINREFLNNNLPMTPYDCIVLYDVLHENFGSEIDKLDVNNVFTEDNKRLSLDDARYYEGLLKEKLIELKDNPKMENIINKYKINYEYGNDINLYNLFKEIKSKNLTPSIVFQQNTEYCKEIFSKLVNYLEKLENLNYPFHYTNLEFAQECYLEAEKERDKFKKSIKLPPDFQGNPVLAIEDRVNKKWAQLTLDFEDKWSKNFERQLTIINSSGVSDKIKKIQKKNLLKEYKEFVKNISLKYVDVFQKHPEFCLNMSSPMTADKIREIRRTIKQKLDISVSYTNVFMQGLKRGVGIYTRDMPPVYNMIVQSLAQNSSLGFVVADVSLALGINMPFRSSCILGYKDSTEFDITNYQQMIGRSGRRGKDREGHIIYANVCWEKLMKGKLSTVKSRYINVIDYSVITSINNGIDNPSQVYNNIIDKSSKKEDIVYNNKFYDDITKNILLWKLREYNMSTRFFCDNLLSIEMDYRKDISFESMTELLRYLGLLFIDGVTDKNKLNEGYKTKLTDYAYNVMKLCKIIEGDYNTFRRFVKLVNLIKNIHNTLIGDKDKYYSFICRHLEALFNRLKNIMFNSNGLN